MKATIQRKVYLTEDEDLQVRRLCAAKGKSFSGLAAEVLARHWQPKRTPVGHVHRRPSSGPVVGFPGRASMPMRL